MTSAAARPSDRDLAAIRLVMRLQHVTSTHIQELAFSNLSNNTACKRCLNRLVKLQYIDRLDRRFIGGSRGGSAHYVYRLGRRGHFLLTDEPYQAKRQPVEHSLAVADCVVILHQLERSGAITVASVLTEPDCHEYVGGEYLKPDLFVELIHPERGRLILWLEIDMATQGRKRIMQKLGMYVSAYRNSVEAEHRKWPEWPICMFVAVDDERAKELLWLIKQLPETARSLFRVTTRANLAELLTG